MTDLDDTIAAPASAAGAGIRAIVRISGPEAQRVAGQCFVPHDRAAWESAQQPRRFSGQLALSGWPATLEVAVHLWPGQRSYTGAPTAEFALPASPPLGDALLRHLYAAGARPARAGEFTLRAFLAGRLDLLQAEGVLGVIEADDHVQLRTALDQLAGGLSGRIVALREQLLLHLADLEAGLDFVDEDIEFVSREELRRRLADAISLLRELTTQAERRLHSSGRLQVVLAGLPNAGKSTLFNGLAARAAAIVSPERGTTRDVLWGDLDCDGLAVTLWDTAGWETGATSLSAAADQARRDRLDRADLVIWCTAADLTAADQRLDGELREQQLSATASLHVVTKSDLVASPGAAPPQRAPIAVCGTTGAGLSSLRNAIAETLRGTAAHHGELLGSTAARCRESLRQAEESLSAALAALQSGAGDELVALDLRAGLKALGLVCGAVYTDDILDRIFSRFCIGK